MLAVGRSMLVRRDLARDAKLAHEALNVFAVDLPALALQLGGQPTRAITRPLSRHLLQSGTQLVLIVCLGVIIVAAAGYLPDSANHLHGIALG